MATDDVASKVKGWLQSSKHYDPSTSSNSALADPEIRPSRCGPDTSADRRLSLCRTAIVTRQFVLSLFAACVCVCVFHRLGLGATYVPPSALGAKIQQRLTGHKRRANSDDHVPVPPAVTAIPVIDAGDDEDSRSSAIKSKAKPTSAVASDMGGASKKAKKAGAAAFAAAPPVGAAVHSVASAGASSPASVTAGKSGIKPPPPPSSSSITITSPPPSPTDGAAAPGAAAAKAPKRRKKDRSRQKNLRKDNRPEHAKPNYLPVKPRSDSSRDAVPLHDQCYD
jgi:hypothetical protein